MKLGLALALFLAACGGATSEEPASTTAASSVDPAPTTEAAPAEHRRPERPPPPPMAFEACASKSVGDACAFDDHEGACIAPPPDAPDARIVCRPSDAPPCR
jgi:hypothetical protein